MRPRWARRIARLYGGAELCGFFIPVKYNAMIELGRARITATDILAFPKGTIVNIGELDDGDETASGADAEGGELVAYVADGDSSHDVDVTEDDFVFIPA